MCGICGIVNYDPEAPVSQYLLERMTDALAHRGPDDHGYFREANAGLGHRRLSIIDLEGGKQPIFNEDQSSAIVFNGEVYNYRDLSADLVSRGHRFRTRSDTEAILHAYEEYGDECVSRFRGMFTFAIWERRAKRLFLARDRLGIKPLYYYQGPSFFAFASELKSLLEIPGVPREVDPEALDLYLSLRYVPGPRTMFRDLWKLQPGHTLSLVGRDLRIGQYWDLPRGETRAIGLEDAVGEFQRLFEESVRLRLIAEVPLGVFLSGGIDSSAILAVMSKITGRQRIKTFSVGYEAATREEESANEFEYARMAAAAFGAEHHEYRVTSQEFCDAIPSLVWHLDEPLADPSCIPLYFIARQAHQHITVVLSGEGADEALAGYSIYKKMLLIERARRLGGPLGRRLLSGAGKWLGSIYGSRYLRAASMPLEKRYRGVSRAFLPETKASLLGSTHGSGHAGSNEDDAALDRAFQPYWERRGSQLDRMLYADTKVWLPDDILLKADKMTMAHALELRVPFLDHKLLEFTASLPSHLKLRDNRGKVLLREAMRGVLPEPILHRSKKGFPVPTEHWLRGPLNDYVTDSLLSSNSACGQFLEPGAIRTLLEQHRSGANLHQEVWTLLVFEAWHQAFLSLRPAGKRYETVEVA